MKHTAFAFWWPDGNFVTSDKWETGEAAWKAVCRGPRKIQKAKERGCVVVICEVEMPDRPTLPPQLKRRPAWVE